MLDGTFHLPKPAEGERYEPLPEDERLKGVIALDEDGRTLHYRTDLILHILLTFTWAVFDNRPPLSSDEDDELEPFEPAPLVCLHICGPTVPSVDWFWSGDGVYCGRMPENPAEETTDSQPHAVVAEA